MVIPPKRQSDPLYQPAAEKKKHLTNADPHTEWNVAH